MVKQKLVWYCQQCGHKQSKWTGCCTQCKEWNSFTQEIELDTQKSRFAAKEVKTAKAVRLSEIVRGGLPRITTKMTEFDRLLGGGLVRGSLTLIGGDPGIGKSTLMLQVSEQLAQQGLIVLYVCGEESVEQTSLRAERLGIRSDSIYFLCETVFDQIKHQIDQVKPDVIIADSIQILYKSELPSAPGSVVQVREIATEFLHISKGMGISTFLIGHVTKSGEIAGPKVLEHLVDTVLDFEGDKQHGYRLLRAMKNRFGPTDEIAVFQMQVEGLREIPNPSSLFLEERRKDLPGSAIVPTVEGSRAFLVEVQALVAASSFATSTRKSAGLDQNRLGLLLAVLEKKMGYQIYNCDVFVSVAGGMKISEPAIDLGVLLAISSSFCNRPIDPQTLVVGEVGLGGELRSVPRIEQRIREGALMGFRTCILPRRNLKGLSKDLLDKMEMVPIDVVEEAINALVN